MGLGQFGGEEETGGLNNHVGVQGTPGDVGGILLAEDLDLVAIDNHEVAFNLDVVVEFAVYGVVLEHVSEIIRIEEVVDTDNLDVSGEILDSCAENHPSDTAETVNTEFDHNFC